MNEANCALYCITGLSFTPRKLSEDFQIVVGLLTENSSDEIYQKFINAFGTHYIYSMKMGSNFGVLTEFTKANWDEMNYHENDISFSASVNAFIKAGIEIKDQEKIEKAKKFESYAERTQTHSSGVSLPISGKIDD